MIHPNVGRCFPCVFVPIYMDIQSTIINNAIASIPHANNYGLTTTMNLRSNEKKKDVKLFTSNRNLSLVVIREKNVSFYL